MRCRRIACVGATTLLAALVVGPSTGLARMADPRPAGEYAAASARDKDIGAHLGESLASANAYERLFALQHISRSDGAVSAEIAPRVAALIADHTKVLSLMCKSCISDCGLCDSCWGLYGNSDCGYVREVRDYAGGPLRVLVERHGRGVRAVPEVATRRLDVRASFPGPE